MSPDAVGAKKSHGLDPEEASVAVAAPSSAPSYIVAALVGIITFLFSGLIFGWAPLQLILEKDGIYRGLCPEAEPLCGDRATRLILIFSVGSTALVLGGTLSGYLMDHIGPLRCTFISGITITTGLLLLAFSNDTSFDAFLPGGLFIGFGGSVVIVSFYPTASVLPLPRQTLFMTLVSALFDASSLVFLGIQLLYDLGLSRQLLLTSFAGICVLLLACLAVAWCRGPLRLLDAEKEAEYAQTEAARRQAQSEDASTTYASSAGSEGYSPTSGGSPPVDATPNEPNEPNECSSDENPRESSEEEEKIASAWPDHVVRPRLHGLTVMQQLRTFECLFAVIWLASNVFRSNLYLGTNKELLEELGDKETGYTYTKIFAASQPVSTLFLPVITCMLDRKGFGFTFSVLVVLGVAYNVVVLVPNLQVQLLAFAIFTNWRAFVFCGHFVFVHHTFGSRTTGRIQGFLYFFAAIANALIWPAEWIASKLEDSNTYLYGFSLILSVPQLAVVAFLVLRLRRGLVSDCKRS